MVVLDYNGTGRWSARSIIERYDDYARRFHVQTRWDVEPRQLHKGSDTWIYPVMDRVIAAIEAGDQACTAIGVEFICVDERFPFGRVLKSNTARALRRAVLTESQKQVIRERVATMLIAGDIPREFKEYVKLLRVIGYESVLSRIEQQADRKNPHVMRFLRYLMQDS